MQSFTLLSLLSLPLLLLIFSASPTTSLAPAPAPESPSAACKSSPYPKLCRTILSSIRASPSDPYSYGKFSVKQCLKQARRLSAVLRKAPSRWRKSPLSEKEMRALVDCQELSELSVDYLEKVSWELKAAVVMNDELVDRVQTYLSAVVTNQQTCYDGLEDSGSSLVTALSGPLLNTTKLYTVSLSLVTQALRRNLNKKHNQTQPQLPGNHHTFRERLANLVKSLQCGPGNASTKRILKQESSSGILVNDIVTVGPNTTYDFTTIEEAVAAAPNNSTPEDGYFVIYIKEGLYHEYLTVPKEKTYVLMVGDGINKTCIVGNHSFVDGWTTFNSSTLAVGGEGFVAIDMTFKNTAGPEKHQAVAVRNSADLSAFLRCSFEGYQDTLYVHSLRQFYRECDIYGTVDFIFGNAAAVFQKCNIYPRLPLPRQKNAITAQGRTDSSQNTGISIQDCNIQAAPDLAFNLSATSTCLGRPWKQYSRTVFMQSTIGDVVDPVGWLEWNGTVGLDTLFYAEFQNSGPGADTSKRVQWPGYNLLKRKDARNFTLDRFILADTWLPFMDIPHHGGLM